MQELKDGKTAINSLLSSVMTTVKNDDDYIGENGLLYCGNCNTRKQFEIEILGELRQVPVMCDCKKAKFEQEEAERKRLALQKETQRLKVDGITDTEYLKWTFEKDDQSNPRISAAVKRYVDKWEQMKADNIGILFYGNVGTGKTFFAACIANAMTNKGVPTLMTNVPLLISAMSKDFESKKAEILRRVSNVPLLILDDIGVERDTAYGYEKLQEIIDTRYRSGKPLIVTTNLTPEMLQNPTEMRYKRVYDRILEMCHPIMVGGRSKRQENAVRKRETAKNILGI